MHIRSLSTLCRTPSAAVVATCLALSGCGGSSAEPETPADEASEAASEGSKEEASESSAEPASEEPPSGDEEEEEASSTDADSADAKSILVREGTAFLINHRESDMGKQAEERCAKSAGDDVAKKANCLSKAINGMDREGVMFDEEGGEWWIIRFVIVKGAKTDLNKVQIEVGEPSGSKIVLKPVGKDKGSMRKGALPKEIEFEVPDEYTVIWHHPQNGKMVYEPKLGLFADSQ